LADSKEPPKTGKIPEKLSKRGGEGAMIIPAAKGGDEIMKGVPKGRLTTVN